MAGGAQVDEYRLRRNALSPLPGGSCAARGPADHRPKCHGQHRRGIPPGQRSRVCQLPGACARIAQRSLFEAVYRRGSEVHDAADGGNSARRVRGLDAATHRVHGVPAALQLLAQGTGSPPGPQAERGGCFIGDSGSGIGDAIPCPCSCTARARRGRSASTRRSA